MSRILVVPGLAVRGYAETAVEALVGAGHDAVLLDPPGWRGRPPDLGGYGLAVAREIADDGRPVDLLVGLSVGGQAAAVAAAAEPSIRRLLLVSPTIDPAQRSRRRLLAAWLRGEDHPDSPSLAQQVPDWRRAGVPRLYRGFVSVLRVPLEDIVPTVSAEVTVAHADHDRLSDHAYAARLADVSGGRLIVLPDGPHSWPIGDADGFVRLVAELLAVPSSSTP